LLLRAALAASALLGLVTASTISAEQFNPSDRAVVTARWAAAPSRFVTVDGVPIHVREEGRKGAPVVVLLHGSIVNLHEWDAVAALLKKSYRVVRFDWSPYGLTGPDPKDVYSTPRAAELMDGLMRALGYKRFVLVATSNGANVALEYNRAYPGHATAMALSILPLERPSQTRKVDPRILTLLKASDQYTPGWRPHEFWRLVIKDTTPPGFEPPRAFVDSIYDMNSLPGALERQARYIAANTQLFRTTDVGAVAEAVTVPVLLQWCEVDDVISQGPEASVARFRNTRVDLIRYPGLGHFPMIEDPDLFGGDLSRWIATVSRRRAN
jgi:pimeloyl-ACP methyl ester carboxylesterase